MAESFETIARSLAYIWYRSTNPEESIEEAWDFARDHWHEFAAHSSDPREGFAGHIQGQLEPGEDHEGPDFSAWDYEGPAQILAEK